jgi:hypothetical protein
MRVVGNEPLVPEVLPKQVDLVEEEDKVIDQWVKEWNDVVIGFESSTLKFCQRLNEFLQQFPFETKNNLIKRITSHPNIKRSLSPLRIYQNVKLLENRPDILDAVERTGSRENKKNYYYKKDGSLFTEFYIELYANRHNIPSDVAKSLELKGIENKWTYRELVDEIHKAKEEYNLTPDTDRWEKAKVMKEIIASLRGLSLENVKRIRQMIYEIKKAKMVNSETKISGAETKEEETQDDN